MAKAIKKSIEQKPQSFIVKNVFKTTKKEYKVGDTIEQSNEKAIEYLKSIKVI